MFRLTRQEQFVIVVLVLLVAAVVIGAAVAHRPAEPGHRVEVALNTAPRSDVQEAELPRTAGPALVVHVAGAVSAPGTYELPVGARVEDAVSRAAPTSEADVHALNLAAKLVDGEKIVVPARGESAAHAGIEGGTGGTDAGGLININTATAAELDSLPGIGPARGADIVEYRRDHPFRCIEDVMDVPGIGPGIFERIKNRIIVR
ncbi:MAG: helix-hairpin-helix domain-containing protein [Verrucomicrobia bacterium]|nr:helix-hairpin-helix domain-containing protein [Verrucomicrobiota bacterium]